jgi:hypothetical protein
MSDSDVKNPELAIEYMFKYGKKFGEAKGKRIYMEEYRKSLKAMIMKRSLETSVNAQEREAYSDPEYVQHLKALQEAVQIEEEIRWGLIAAQARVEVWRSIEATNRAEGKATI